MNNNNQNRNNSKMYSMKSKSQKASPKRRRGSKKLIRNRERENKKARMENNSKKENEYLFLNQYFVYVIYIVYAHPSQFGLISSSNNSNVCKFFLWGHIADESLLCCLWILSVHLHHPFYLFNAKPVNQAKKTVLFYGMGS